MEDSVIRVVVGKEKKEFMVEPYVLEETPFRVLIGSVTARFLAHKNFPKNMGFSTAHLAKP